MTYSANNNFSVNDLTLMLDYVALGKRHFKGVGWYEEKSAISWNANAQVDLARNLDWWVAEIVETAGSTCDPELLARAKEMRMLQEAESTMHCSESGIYEYVDAGTFANRYKVAVVAKIDDNGPRDTVVYFPDTCGVPASFICVSNRLTYECSSVANEQLSFEGDSIFNWHGFNREGLARNIAEFLGRSVAGVKLMKMGAIVEEVIATKRIVKVSVSASF
jgi:hypothetical protein